MLAYIINRTGLAVLIVVVAMTLLYGMIHAVPGDPANVILGPRATPEMKLELQQRMGLDKPVAVQLFTFFANVATGDLGVDVFSNQPVSDLVFEMLPHTLWLVVAGIVWAIILGIPMGCYSAVRRNSFLDKFIGVISVGTIAIPSFVVALYALLLFAVKLKWLPAIGAGEEGNFTDMVMHLILPAFAVGLGWVGYIARMVRASMLEVLGEHHIRTVKAFGLPSRLITYRYALRLAILPTITILGVGIGRMISNAVFAEIVFARPGIGKLIFDAVATRNYPVVMGSVLISTILFVLATTLADFLAAFFDPRIRKNL
ncbi:MAG: ABC transporter permease [Desulfobacterales bacterium]|nr:ABC transporter permease [Desulfobacterales bacterium]